MKKVLLATMLGAAVATSATAGSVEYSYADGCSNYLGTQKKENYDVAIFLPGEQFKDFNVTSFKVPVNVQRGNKNYANVKVWLSTELNIDNKLNAPDVASYEASVSEDGMISVDFPEAYTITDKGVYVGYSFDISALDSGTKYPLGIGEPSDENGLYVHTSRSYLKWTNIATLNGCSSAMSVELQSDKMPAESVSFFSMPDPVYLSLGEAKTVNVILSTAGSEPVGSVDFEYTVAGVKTSYHYDLPEVIPASLGKKFNASFVVPAQTSKFAEQAEFAVTKVNGNANMAQNISKSAQVVVVSEVPVHQALFEEYTGTWCGWCTRGYAALEHIKKNYPDFVVAAFHNGDDMAITSNYPNDVPGYPSAVLDRSVVCDPYYGTQTYNSMLPIVDDIMAINQEFTPWNIKVSHTWDSDDILTANVDVSCLSDVENGNYKIAYLLVADGLSGTTSKWNQGNNYASQQPSDNNIPELNAFCRGGEFGKSSVKGLVFDDVVISATGIHGVNGSIPANLASEEVASHSLSFDLTKVKEALLPDRNKLRIIAIVLDGSGKALNCAKDEVNDYTGTGVEDVEVTDNDAPVEYYNLNGVKVDNPSNGIFIRRQGKRTSKVVLK